MTEELMLELEEKMDKAVAATRDSFQKVRTGRATPNMLDGIKVDYYGQTVPLSQVAGITIPDARMIVIQPWEKNMLGIIEKEILRSDLGMTPINDGVVLRLKVPELSEERRKEYVKMVKKMAEDGRIAIRNIRRDGNERTKKMEKNSDLSKDQAADLLTVIQKLTDEKIKDLDDSFAAKEKELLTV